MKLRGKQGLSLKYPSRLRQGYRSFHTRNRKKIRRQQPTYHFRNGCPKGWKLVEVIGDIFVCVPPPILRLRV